MALYLIARLQLHPDTGVPEWIVHTVMRATTAPVARGATERIVAASEVPAARRSQVARVMESGRVIVLDPVTRDFTLRDRPPPTRET